MLLPDLRAGGAERLHVTLAREWQALGVRTTFLLRSARGDLLSQLPPDADVVDLGAARVRDLPRPLTRHLERHPPDALLAAMWPLTVVGPAAARAARLRGPVVVSEHSPLSIAYSPRGAAHRAWMRSTMAVGYRLATERVAVSSGVADDLAALSGLPRDRFRVVHNPITTGTEPLRGTVPRPPELADLTGPIVLAVGTLKAVKRYDLLLDSVRRLPTALGATLVIVGDGPERGRLEARATESGIRARFVGYRAHLGPWYASADVFVCSSEYEGFGNVIVEALAHGVSVVSTACPTGPSEILENGRFGRLVPVHDADALTAGIQAALERPDDGAALRVRASAFGTRAIAEQYLQLLRRSD